MIVRPCREEELPLVLEMSDAWVEEGCCNGMERDDLEYLKQFEIFLALEDERPVGYAYGRARTAQKNSGATQKGELFFDVEGIYVKPAQRNTGCGTLLYKALEQSAQMHKCRSMQLTAVSRDYRRLLHFYIDVLGMEFWSALLTKRL